MALFPFHRYHFFDDFFDPFFSNRLDFFDPFFPSRLDFFDPWYDFNMSPSFPSIIPRSRRVKQQERLTYSSSSRKNSTKSLEPTSQAPQTENFRVQVNIDGFNPDTIKPRIEGRKLIVEGKQEERRGERDYTIRELRESHELPEYVDANRLTSYVAPKNTLVIEAPTQNSGTERRLQQAKDNNQSLSQFGQFRDRLFDDIGFLGGSDFQPRIIDKGNNQKQLEMSVEMKNFQPQEINVSVENNQLIVQAEHQYNDANRSERSSFYKSTTLPPGTQVDQLKSHLASDGQLKLKHQFFNEIKRRNQLKAERNRH